MNIFQAPVYVKQELPRDSKITIVEAEVKPAVKPASTALNAPRPEREKMSPSPAGYTFNGFDFQDR